MRVTVRLFALYRERAGADALTIDVPPGGRVADLLSLLGERCPRLSPLVDHTRVAVNHEFVEPSHILHEGDEVALIPPVSGGETPMVWIAFQPLDPEAVTARVRHPGNGGVVTFLGTTRNETDGRRVLYLEYEAYLPMAYKKMAQVVEEAKERFGVPHVAVAHRLGRLEVGEISLVVAVGAPHRREAFAAAAYIVDRIKEMVPIWKKEVFEGGAVWVGSQEATPPPGPSGGP
jgi:molybdopterin converting factor subunit 1